MKEEEYRDVNTLIDAIKLAKSSKIKEYEQVGHVAVKSLKALQNLIKLCPKGKGACPLKADLTK